VIAGCKAGLYNLRGIRKGQGNGNYVTCLCNEDGKWSYWAVQKWESG
jgi:hypothetical protein